MRVTVDQIRGARGMLNWSQADLAERSGISKDTMRRIETGKSAPQHETFKKIVCALELAGIEFIEKEGIRKKSHGIRIFDKQDGFWDFYNDLFETIRKDGGEVLVSNVDEREFEKWLGEKLQEHRERMYPLRNYALKIITQEGDHNTLSQYEHTEYRWMEKSRFSNLPFYVYGNKLALIDFEPENVTVFLHDHPKIADAFRKNFHILWNQAVIPPEEEHT